MPTNKTIAKRAQYTRSMMKQPSGEIKLNSRDVKRLTDIQVTAIESNLWDFPEKHQFASPTEMYAQVCNGQSCYDFCYQAIVKYGTITGGILAMGFGKGYVSHSTRKAIREGVKYAMKLQHISKQFDELSKTK